MFNGRCRASDTFSRLWKYMARWYYWRVTAQTLRTDVSRAKFGGEGGYLKSRSQFRLALPRRGPAPSWAPHAGDTSPASPLFKSRPLDRKSTRLNSSHQIISYAVFCLKKKIK